MFKIWCLEHIIADEMSIQMMLLFNSPHQERQTVVTWAQFEQWPHAASHLRLASVLSRPPLYYNLLTKCKYKFIFNIS